MSTQRIDLTVGGNVLALLAALAIAGGSGYSFATGGLVASILDTSVPATMKLAALREFFHGWGPWAPLAYVLFVTAEVLIAPLPGLILYAPGGVIFGGFLGGLYSLLGNLIGAAIACQLARMLGASRLGDKMRAAVSGIQPALEKRGLWIVFFLRINPFTSSDLVSYAAGLAAIPTWKVLVGTGFGMAPLCWLQSYLAEGVLRAFPALVYPLVALCILYGLAVVWILRKLILRPGAA